MYSQSLLQASPASYFAMETIDQKVRAFLEEKEWKPADLAEAVGTSRQNIDNLLGGIVKIPGYIVELANTMETTTDYLLGREDRNPRHCARAPASIVPLPRPSIRSALVILGDALSRASRTRRRTIAALLGDLAENPKGEETIDALCGLLDPPQGGKGKRRLSK